MYEYRAIVREVIDGDTVRVDLDLGCRVWIRGETVRLARINAPELRGETRPVGLAARDYLAERVLGAEITLRTILDRHGKYGRLLGELWLGGENLNDSIVAAGHAIYASYEAPDPVTRPEL